MDAEAREVQRIAGLLGAASATLTRPKAKGGVVVPELWVLELGGFASWPGEQTWELCFGKDSRCLVDPDQPTTTTCAEVIVARRLAAAGFDAGWLNTYRSAPAPVHWTPRIAHTDARDLLAGVCPAVAATVGAAGTPDVLALGSDGVVFVEVKRHPDRLSPQQVAWITFALASGVDRASMLVAHWTGLG